MHRVLLALLLTACVAANTPEACRIVPVAAIPIRMAGTIPLLDVTINGHPARLMLDTGAEGTTVAAEAFDRLGLQRDYARPAYVTGLGAQTVNWLSRPVETALGPLALPAAPLLVTAVNWSMRGEDRPDGLLGSAALSQFDVDIDMKQRRLMLYRPRRCPAGPPPFDGATVSADNNRAYKLTIPVTLDGAALTAEVDTGASRTLVDGASAGLSDADVAADRTVHFATADPVGADIRMHRFGRLTVGSDVVERPLLGVSAMGRGGYDALLGSDYWLTRRVWLSYAGRTITVGPSQPRPR